MPSLAVSPHRQVCRGSQTRRGRTDARYSDHALPVHALLLGLCSGAVRPSADLTMHVTRGRRPCSISTPETGQRTSLGETHLARWLLGSAQVVPGCASTDIAAQASSPCGRAFPGLRESHAGWQRHRGSDVDGPAQRDRPDRPVAEQAEDRATTIAGADAPAGEALHHLWWRRQRNGRGALRQPARRMSGRAAGRHRDRHVHGAGVASRCAHGLHGDGRLRTPIARTPRAEDDRGPSPRARSALSDGSRALEAIESTTRNPITPIQCDRVVLQAAAELPRGFMHRPVGSAPSVVASHPRPPCPCRTRRPLRRAA